MQNFKLINKINLTHNVYEMDFEAEWEISMKPWQFITFILDKIGWRAYSILSIEWKVLKLIIKKRELEDWWRWWSKFICEANIWDLFKWVWPAWHFNLVDNNDAKLFIWTGTWLVPLYNMFIHALENSTANIHFTFGLREEKDVFYIDELNKLKDKYSNFDFHIYISRVKDLHEFKIEQKTKNINSWYTTNFLTKDNVSEYKEVYICWAPMMIEATVEKLEKLWFKNWENIFFEKF